MNNNKQIEKLSKEQLELLDDIKDGETIYDNIEGRAIFKELLEIERSNKAIVTIIYGNELRDIIGEDQMTNEYYQSALCGVFLTPTQQKKLTEM